MSAQAGRDHDAVRDDPLQQLDDLFDQVEQYRLGKTDDAVDVRYEALLPVVDRAIPVIVTADSQLQIESAVAFAARRTAAFGDLRGIRRGTLCAIVART